MLVGWDESYLGCIDGLLYGSTVDCILADEDEIATEEVLALKVMAQPPGIRAVQSWAESGFTRDIPDSIFTLHVLELNLATRSREAERLRCDVTVKSSHMTLVYAKRAGEQAVVVNVTRYSMKKFCEI